MKERLSQAQEVEQDLRPIKLSERVLWHVGFHPPFEREDAWYKWLYRTVRVPTPTADFGNAAGPHNFDPLPPPNGAFRDEVANGLVAEAAMEIEDPWSGETPLYTGRP